MNTDEALEIIRQTKGCWVVFSSETGEVLSVVGDRPGDTAQDRLAHLATLSSYNQPVKTRHFKSAEVTREVLERERGEAEQGKTRVDVLTEWSRLSVDELLQALERGLYDDPMDKDDSTILVDHLWEVHRDELTLAVCERLTLLLSRNVLSESARNRLRFYLAALHGDEESLKAMWAVPKSMGIGSMTWEQSFALMDSLAHVRTKDQEIIDGMLGIFELVMPFGPKFDTMIALGKIGPAAGRRAAEVIRRTVYDSEPWIKAVRDRVLERLESTEDEWTTCGACCYGRIHAPDTWGVRSCPLCLGIGYLPASHKDMGLRQP